MRENLPYLAAHRREDLAQNISLFLAKVLRVSDKYANQRQISIDEGYLRLSTFKQLGTQIPRRALSNWHPRGFFQKQAVHNR